MIFENEESRVLNILVIFEMMNSENPKELNTT